MKTTKHTPGPWHVGLNPGPIVYGPLGAQIADLRFPMLPDSEHAANISLISRAPDMLFLLKRITALLESGDGIDKDSTEYTQLVALIDSIEGK